MDRGTTWRFGHAHTWTRWACTGESGAGPLFHPAGLARREVVRLPLSDGHKKLAGRTTNWVSPHFIFQYFFLF